MATAGLKLVVTLLQTSLALGLQAHAIPLMFKLKNIKIQKPTCIELHIENTYYYNYH